MSMENVPSAQAEKGKLGAGAIATIGGAAALVIFMLQNTDPVTIEFLFWDFEWPEWLLTLVAALVWFGVGVLRRHRRREERRDDRRD